MILLASDVAPVNIVARKNKRALGVEGGGARMLLVSTLRGYNG
jgi:hypothetical protein